MAWGCHEGVPRGTTVPKRGRAVKAGVMPGKVAFAAADEQRVLQREVQWQGNSCLLSMWHMIRPRMHHFGEACTGQQVNCMAGGTEAASGS